MQGLYFKREEGLKTLSILFLMNEVLEANHKAYRISIIL